MSGNTNLVGILNVTPDSFSDGGNFLSPAEALLQAKKLIEDGSSVIDIGAESTRPGSVPLNHVTEWTRLEKILPDLIKLCRNHKVLVSLDSYHPETIKKAVDLGIDWINDQTGFNNPEVLKIARKSNCNLVVMHNLGIPADKNKVIEAGEDPVHLILKWMEDKLDILTESRINKDRIIFDPGIGFGKNAEQSIAILKRIHEFKQLGIKILVGHSRKSFMQSITTSVATERDPETIAISIYLKNLNIDYLRVHNVSAHLRAFRALEVLNI